MNRSRVLTAIVAVLLLVVVSLLGPSVSASSGPRVSLRPRAAAPTAQVQVQGVGYQPGERVELSLDATRMATFTVGQDGSFTHAFVVPPRTLPGDHLVTAHGMRSGRVGSAPLVVRTNWAQGWFDAAHTAFNPLENVVAPRGTLVSLPPCGRRWCRVGSGPRRSSPTAGCTSATGLVGCTPSTSRTEPRSGPVRSRTPST